MMVDYNVKGLKVGCKSSEGSDIIKKRPGESVEKASLKKRTSASERFYDRRATPRRSGH